MKEQRWLLPFTHGVDTRAIETVVRTAEARGATLVSVALIVVPSGGSTRLDRIQQAKDFLEVVQHLAAQHQVKAECHEAFTADVKKGIRQIIQDLRSDGLILVTHKQQGILLSTDEIASLLLTPSAPLILIRLPVQKASNLTDRPLVRLFSGLCMPRRRPDEVHKREQVVTQEGHFSPSTT